MPPISPFLVRAPLSLLNKRDYVQSQGRDDSDVKSPVAMVGVVVAALTLLAALIPLFRCPRFRRWVSSLSIPSLVKVYPQLLVLIRHVSHIHSYLYNPTQKAPRIITPANPPSTITTAMEDSGADIAIPGPVLIILHNGYSNARVVSTHSSTSPYRHNVITRVDGRVPHVERPLGPRIPEPTVTRLSSHR
ncbi:hypothetical protein HOY80DRAFT_982957 [Tuber brumale]|nr:hypothetical protein HOY80DRAFT_982957 [Tuber brumale]